MCTDGGAAFCFLLARRSPSVPSLSLSGDVGFGLECEDFFGTIDGGVPAACWGWVGGWRVLGGSHDGEGRCND